MSGHQDGIAVPIGGRSKPRTAAKPLVPSAPSYPPGGTTPARSTEFRTSSSGQASRASRDDGLRGGKGDKGFGKTTGKGGKCKKGEKGADPNFQPLGTRKPLADAADEKPFAFEVQEAAASTEGSAENWQSGDAGIDENAMAEEQTAQVETDADTDSSMPAQSGFWGLLDLPEKKDDASDDTAEQNQTPTEPLKQAFAPEQERQVADSDGDKVAHVGFEPKFNFEESVKHGADLVQLQASVSWVHPSEGIAQAAIKCEKDGNPIEWSGRYHHVFIGNGSTTEDAEGSASLRALAKAREMLTPLKAERSQTDEIRFLLSWCEFVVFLDKDSTSQKSRSSEDVGGQTDKPSTPLGGPLGFEALTIPKSSVLSASFMPKFQPTPKLKPDTNPQAHKKPRIMTLRPRPPAHPPPQTKDDGDEAPSAKRAPGPKLKPQVKALRTSAKSHMAKNSILKAAAKLQSNAFGFQSASAHLAKEIKTHSGQVTMIRPTLPLPPAFQNAMKSPPPVAKPRPPVAKQPEVQKPHAAGLIGKMLETIAAKDAASLNAEVDGSDGNDGKFRPLLPAPKKGSETAVTSHSQPTDSPAHASGASQLNTIMNSSATSPSGWSSNPQAVAQSGWSSSSAAVQSASTNPSGWGSNQQSAAQARWSNSSTAVQPNSTSQPGWSNNQQPSAQSGWSNSSATAQPVSTSPSGWGNNKHTPAQSGWSNSSANAQSTTNSAGWSTSSATVQSISTSASGWSTNQQSAAQSGWTNSSAAVQSASTNPSGWGNNQSSAAQSGWSNSATPVQPISTGQSGWSNNQQPSAQSGWSNSSATAQPVSTSQPGWSSNQKPVAQSGWSNSSSTAQSISTNSTGWGNNQQPAAVAGWSNSSATDQCDNATATPFQPKTFFAAAMAPGESPHKTSTDTLPAQQKQARSESLPKASSDGASPEPKPEPEPEQAQKPSRDLSFISSAAPVESPPKAVPPGATQQHRQSVDKAPTLTQPWGSTVAASSALAERAERAALAGVPLQPRQSVDKAPTLTQSWGSTVAASSALAERAALAGVPLQHKQSVDKAPALTQPWGSTVAASSAPSESPLKAAPAEVQLQHKQPVDKAPAWTQPSWGLTVAGSSTPSESPLGAAAAGVPSQHRQVADKTPAWPQAWGSPAVTSSAPSGNPLKAASAGVTPQHKQWSPSWDSWAHEETPSTSKPQQSDHQPSANTMARNYHGANSSNSEQQPASKPVSTAVSPPLTSQAPGASSSSSVTTSEQRTAHWPGGSAPQKTEGPAPATVDASRGHFASASVSHSVPASTPPAASAQSSGPRGSYPGSLSDASSLGQPRQAKAAESSTSFAVAATAPGTTSSQSNWPPCVPQSGVGVGVSPGAGDRKQQIAGNIAHPAMPVSPSFPSSGQARKPPGPPPGLPPGLASGSPAAPLPGQPPSRGVEGTLPGSGDSQALPHAASSSSRPANGRAQGLNARPAGAPHAPGHGSSQASRSRSRSRNRRPAASFVAVKQEESQPVAVSGKAKEQPQQVAISGKAKDDLLAELQSLKQSALLKRAAAVGASGDEVDAAADSDDPKAALVELIVSKTRFDAKAALVSELQALKQSALIKRAQAVGADSDEVDTAVDNDDPKAALVSLIVSKTKFETEASAPQRPAPADAAGLESMVARFQALQNIQTGAQAQTRHLKGASASVNRTEDL